MSLSGYADDALDSALVPVEELADCAAATLGIDGKRILSYGTGAGYTPLRELIGEWFGVHPERVVLTNGSLQALSLLGRIIDPKRGVMAEYPVSDRVQVTFLEAGKALYPVTVDENGLLVSELQQQLMQYLRPGAVYTIPAFHNPTGWCMSPARRRALVDAIADENRMHGEDTLLIEDDAYGLTRFEGDRVPGLFDYTSKQSVYTSSFSATVAPGLRVGWIIAPEQIASRLIAAANGAYISPVLLAQATIFEFIRRGSFEAQVQRVRDGLKLRRDTFLSAVAQRLPDVVTTRPEGGLFSWMRFPPGIDTRPFIAGANLRMATDGTAFASTSNFIRFAYGTGSPETIVSEVERLASAYLDATTVK